MSDYDIVIKLDPGQPVAGAAKVTEAVAKVEVQGEKAKAAMDGIAESAKKLKSIDFKQGAAAAAQGWSLLSQKMKLAESDTGEVIDSAVRFGAIGAQVAGPWGAALGAIGGGLLELDNKLDTVIDKALRLADAKAVQDAWNAAIAWGASETHRLTSGLDAMHKALDGIAQARALAATVPGLIGLQAFNEEMKRQKDLLEKIQGPQRDYHANIDSLNAMLKSGKITSTQFNNAITELNKGFESDAPKQYVDKLKEARDLFLAFRADLQKEAATSTRATRRGGGYSDANESFDQVTSQAADDLEEQRQQQIRDTSPSDLDADVANMDAMVERSKQLVFNTAKWNEELKQSNATTTLIADQLKGAGTTLLDTLVDAANGADVSWSKTLKNILIGFEKAVAQALLLQALTGSATGARGIGGSYGGLFGLLGFASGGVISPSGAGTTDTQTVMFRKAPSETVRIHTPGQEAAYQGGGSSPVTVQVVDQRDSRALAPSRADHQMFVELARQNQGFLRGLNNR